MQKYKTFFGSINDNRKIYVFTVQGKAQGSCEPLEKWLEDNDYTLVSLLQPDPVRVPHKVNIVVFKPNLADINYADIETRVLYCGMDMAEKGGDVTLAALLKDKFKEFATDQMTHESDRERGFHSRESTRSTGSATGRFTLPFPSMKRRTKPKKASSKDEPLFRLRVLKDGFIKFETKAYTKLTLDRLRPELAERFPDCHICRIIAE